MKVLVLYRPNSERSSEVESFVRDMQRMHDPGKKLELVSIDTRDGAATASLYDILQFPAIIVLGDDGSMINSWIGSLPLMDELAGYINL